MRGKVVLRYVGNRQEPEKYLVDPKPLVWMKEVNEFTNLIEEWNREWKKQLFPKFQKLGR